MHVLKTEWLKIRNYPAFWWVMGMTALSYPGINYIFWNMYLEITKKQNAAGKIAKMLLGNPFTFPETFHTTAYFSSFFVFIPAIVVIMLITNEYTYKTNRQNIIDGWSRNQFLLSKFFDVLMITLMVTLLYFIIALIIGISASTPPITRIWEQARYVWLFALLTFSQLSFAFLIGFLVRKSFIALSIFVFYFLIVENFVVNIARIKVRNSDQNIGRFLPYDIGRFMPLEISDRLIPVPAFLGRLDDQAYKASLDAINIHILYTFMVTGLIWGLCYYFNKKRDL